MQLGHLKTIHAPSEMVDGTFQKITALDWSPNSLRLAVATVDRYIILYDENFDQKDKFSTKPGNKKAPRNYIVRTIAFSPDSTKLAVAQSDNIVFIYKLGSDWKDKKTICNKFAQTSPVTTLCWPEKRHNEVVFGLKDGKLRIGILRNNKSATLYHTDSYVVSSSRGPDGQSFVSGHLDGSIYRYTFPDQDGPVQALLTQASFVPYCLGWGEHVVAAGNTGLVVFYDMQGRQVQQFDYSGDEKVKEFSAISFNPSGQTCVLGNFNRFYVYVYNVSRGIWDEAGVTNVENIYTVTSLCWKSDGSRLVTGSLCGAVDTYDACIRRYLYRGKFEFTYTSLSSVIVKRLSSGSRMALKSRFGCEIKKINIYQDRYLVAHTPETLLMGDLQTASLSEVTWNGSGQEKFFFDNDHACMIFNAGELSLIEYGNHEVLGSLRTEYMNPHQISLRLNEARNEEETSVKKIAYLLDQQAVRVMDLTTGIAEATLSHDVKIDWMELNQRATKLLFRDKRRALHLFDVKTQTRTTLLNFCNYVQWVPDSDVCVAQSRRNLCVWYSIDNPSDVTNMSIKGDVQDIERSGGRTEVIVDEGVETATYPLDESLIAFGSAVDGKDYARAAKILELQTEGKGAEAMWKQLCALSLQDNKLAIAERCYAALGDMSGLRFMSELNKKMRENNDNPNHPLVRYKMFLLNRQFKRAEAILLQQGGVDLAIDMYRQLHKYDEALQVAESKSHPKTMQIRQEYYDYLINTKQEEIAGDLKGREGDFHTAIQLYLKGGYPAKAADMVLQHQMEHDTNLTTRVADSLVQTKQYEKAGEFLEALRHHKRALECYCRGHAFFRAVELARTAFPAQVVRLEEEWGDWLVIQKQMDAASNHYIQAGAYLKAINAAIDARQWTKAVQILDQIEPSTAKPYYKRIAHHYAETKKYEEAERYYLAGDLPQEAVQMYTSAGQWDKAHKIAVTYMPESEVGMLYVTQAQLMESQGKFKEAEKLYLTVKEPDLAISMYKKNRQYDDMIRLVTQCRKELLMETHIHLARQFQGEGNFKLAEKHYIAAKEWKPVVSMYRENDMWEECLRVAKQHGGQNAYKQVAYAFAVSVGGDAGVKLLAKRGLGEQAVDYAIERGEFNEAFHIAEKSCKDKLPEVHLQYAMALEDEGRYEKAEEEFIKAKKPKESIDMYIHVQKWDCAMRVAEQHEPAAIADVQEAQGRGKEQAQDYAGAEILYIQAKKPELAVKMYKEARMFDEATRVARKWAPRLEQSVQQEKLSNMGSTPAAEGGDYLVQQAKLLQQQKNYKQAIDAYLKITQNHTSDYSILSRVWETAVNLTMEHMPNRVNDVVETVSDRLVGIGRYEQAADLLLGIDFYKEAIDAYIQGKMFDKARQVAQTVAPQYISYVDQYYQGDLKNEGNVGKLGDVNPDAAIEMYVNRNEWEQVYDLAAKQGDDVLNKYVSINAKRLTKEGKYPDACRAMLRAKSVLINKNFQLYKRLAQEIFNGNYDDNSITEVYPDKCPDALSDLRDLLFKLVTEMTDFDRSAGGNDDSFSNVMQEFKRLFQIAHISVLRVNAHNMGMKEIAGKNAISALRYTADIPVDRAFYMAGQMCKDLDWGNNAFVFCNRFVDISDLIEDPESGDIDNNDFTETDIPSVFKIPIPTNHAYNEEDREEVRDWVLEKAMSKDGDQSLNKRTCEKCSSDTYEAGLICHNCGHQHAPCVVTGYPVMRHKAMRCRTCDQQANRDDWNTWVSKTRCCPYCSADAQPQH